MGTGKTKLAIDTACWLYEQGEIDGLLVVAPNGVHRNWVDNELPKHAWVDYYAHAFHSRKARTKAHTSAVEETITGHGLTVLTMGYEAFITDKGKAAAADFLKNRDVLMVLDESARIKTPSAKRTRSIVKAGKLAKYRRIMTGTPATNGPFDIFSQYLFLSPSFWMDHGFGNFTTFRSYFGVFEDGWNSHTGREFKQLVRYRNLDKLHDMIDPLSSRVTKDQVLDLPPKLYSTREFDLSKEQSRLYEAFKSSSMEELLEALGDDFDLPQGLAIVIMLRLQQITCGYLPNPEGELKMIDGPNPRLEELKEICEELDHPAIIWARFQKDIDLISKDLKGRCVTYDGRTGPDERAEAIERFQNGDVQFFVANPAAAGEGLTLTAARTVVYYNNSFKLDHRLQSEDRAHRIGQEHPVHYIDLVARETLDDKILKTLVAKKSIADTITGDELKAWLS